MLTRTKSTPISDQELTIAINEYMASHKMVTQGELRKKFKTSIERLERLNNAGVITLPKKLSRSAGSTLGRKKSNAFANWSISRPTPKQGS